MLTPVLCLAALFFLALLAFTHWLGIQLPQLETAFWLLLILFFVMLLVRARREP